MRISFTPQRLARHFLAVVFAACATAFSVLWIYQAKYSTPRPGITNYEYLATDRTIKVGGVLPGSPADQAGLRPGDRIVAIDGHDLKNLRPFYDTVIAGQKEVIELTVKQPGSAVGQRKLELVLHGGKRVPQRTMRLGDLLGLPIDYFPVGFLVVGVMVLLLRPDDRNAWLLALLFCGFLAAAPLYEGNIPLPLRGFVMFYKIAMMWSSLALFYYFFAVFPAASPVDQRIPWLKHVLLAGALISAVPVGLRCLITGGTLPLYLGLHWPGAAVITWALSGQNGLPTPASHGWPTPGFLFFAFFLGSVALGLMSLIANAFLSADAQVRRKAHVMVWGTVVGVVPVCLVAGTAFAGLLNLPLAVWQLSVLLLLSVWPLSFAYAVVKHRVLEIPVLLKRSARYVLVQRGYVVFLFVVAGTAIALFTHTISQLFPRGTNIGMTISAVFGIVLVWASVPIVKKGTERIDQAFFRSAYDARVILQDLAEKARAVTDREELLRLLQEKIEGALHPKALACYLEGSNGTLVSSDRIAHGELDAGSMRFPRPKFPFYPGATFVPEQSGTIPANLPLLKELAQRGRAWDIPHTTEVVDDTASFDPECLVPILGRQSRLLGLLVLGQRLSEEPYSNEDRQLLDSVASQAGITLENIQLAERMAERMEAERQVAMEMDIARRVQARLFPQKLPPLKTLDYGGGCVQAREVGGDYYDFLDMGPEAMGIVLADISGKGISGALLMANLQANLRSQYAVALKDLPRLLQSVNRLFYENTTDESYATMFFGVYQDSRRTLRFANCGHIPPLIFRTDGTVQRLPSTTTVLGLFAEWESPIEVEDLYPGDLLVLCTDGVTEAANPQGEEYGDTRIVDVIQKNRSLPVNKLLAAIEASVQEFSSNTQSDDITLIVARCC